PPGRPLTPQERAQMGQIIKRLEQDLTLYQPLLSGLKGQAAGLAEALKDAEPRVIEVAANTLEALGEARRRLRGLLDSVPVAGKEGVPDKGDEDPLGPILRKGVPALAAQVGHPNVRSRLACLYALEAAGADAAPAAQAVIKALKDENAFVRWAAVRALGRMAPLKGAQADAANAVTGLARCLKDDNADVRGTAFVALSRYGPAAKPAVAALAEIVKASSGDTVPAIRTLEAIGPEAKVAIPALMAALEAKSPQVRAAAARLLGKLGPDAVQAAAALTRVLGDPNVEVRQAAAEALLAVTPAEK
ncbi:MAG TPA: HEAT repeat domain-containing protein, partial [Gemmataceae bacterium]|nr:HEAT repeat domain-containing protein [Gemmataceae bacterium]